METRAKWTDLIAGVGLDIGEVFNQGQEEYTPGIFNILNRKSGTGAQRNVSGKTGAGELERFDDGDNIPGGNRYKTYTTKIVYNNYGKYLDVTKNTIEDKDERYQQDLDEMKDLSIASNYSQDRSGMQLFNGGFSTTETVNGYKMSWYGGGEPLFSTIQSTTVPGGSTQSNASATSIPFSYDNIETADIALDEQQTDDGIPVTMMGQKSLVVSRSDKKEATQATDSELDPDTAENAINVYRGGTYEVRTSLHLSSTNGGSDTAWFMVVPNRHKLYHEVRQAPSLDQDVNVKNKVVTFTVDARWADSVTDWRRTWGSKGDNSSYSS